MFNTDNNGERVICQSMSIHDFSAVRPQTLAHLHNEQFQAALTSDRSEEASTSAHALPLAIAVTHSSSGGSSPCLTIDEAIRDLETVGNRLQALTASPPPPADSGDPVR